jgi:hypothetical protein
MSISNLDEFAATEINRNPSIRPCLHTLHWIMRRLRLLEIFCKPVKPMVSEHLRRRSMTRFDCKQYPVGVHPFARQVVFNHHYFQLHTVRSAYRSMPAMHTRTSACQPQDKARCSRGDCAHPEAVCVLHASHTQTCHHTRGRASSDCSEQISLSSFLRTRRSSSSQHERYMLRRRRRTLPEIFTSEKFSFRQLIRHTCRRSLRITR